MKYYLTIIIILVIIIAGILVSRQKKEETQIQRLISDNNNTDNLSQKQVTINQDASASFEVSKNTKEDLYYPAEDVDVIVANLSEKANEYIDLSIFESDLRTSIADGWTSPWQNLAPKLTREESITMSTKELAEICFSSSIFARTQLLYDEPIYAISRLKVLYPCYDELFKRDDLWVGVINAYSLYSSNLNQEEDPNLIIDNIMGLDNISRIFRLPILQEQIENKEHLIIKAHLEALKGLRLYIENDENEALKSSTPFFNITTPITLVNFALAFMKKASTSNSVPSIDNISKLQLPKEPNMGETKNYIDSAISEIEKYLKSYQE